MLISPWQNVDPPPPLGQFCSNLAQKFTHYFKNYINILSKPIKPTIFIEIKSGLIEIIQPTSIVYLYLQNSSNVPITINSTNTRTKLVNNNFLLLCPTNYTKIQVAKLTGNPLSTIDNQLNLNITI